MTEHAERNESTIIRASLVLVGFDQTPEEISLILGIPARRSGMRKKVVDTGARSDWAPSGNDSYWSIRSRLPQTASLEDHLADLLAQVLPAKPAMEDILKRAQGRIYVTIDSQLEVPILEISPQVLEGIGSLGLPLALDIPGSFKQADEDPESS